MAMQKGAAKARELLSRTGYGKHSDAGADRQVIRAAVHAHERHDHPGTALTKLARGGAANAKGKGKHHAVKVNINVMQPPHQPEMPQRMMAPPMPAPAAPMRPPMAGPPPGAGPGMPPGAAGPGLGTGLPPQRPPGLARGGKVPHMTAGAATGVGREEKIEQYGSKGRRS